MHLAGLAGFDDERCHGPALFANHVVVHCASDQEGRDRCHVLGAVAVGQDHEVGPTVDGCRDLRSDAVQRRRQAGAAVGHRVQARDDLGGEPGPVDLDQACQLLTGQDRVFGHYLAARVRFGREQVVFGAQPGVRGGHDLFADGIQRRVGDLGEELLEVVVEHPRPSRQHRNGGVGSHGAKRLFPVGRHGGDEQFELFVGVAEGLLTGEERRLLGALYGALSELVQEHLVFIEPLCIGAGRSDGGLDLVVPDDAPLFGVDEEHTAGLEATLLYDIGLVNGNNTDLGGHDHAVVVGDPVPGRPQAVAVQYCAHHGPVGEDDGGRAIPWLHQARVVAVEGLEVGIHRLVVFPRLGDHHQHRFLERVAPHDQELQALVEPGGVGGTGGADGEDAIKVFG